MIADDTPTEILQREVELLRDIHPCIQSDRESSSSYSNRFCGVVARYGVQTVELDSVISHQFAVLMIQNTKLSSDTRSSLIVKFMTESALSQPECAITLPISLINDMQSLSGNKTDNPDSVA